VQSGKRTNTAGNRSVTRYFYQPPIATTTHFVLISEYISLPNHRILHEAGRLEFAYFPNRGLISLVVVMKDGGTAEAGIVGKKGFTGIPAAVGLNRSTLQAVVQITGDGFRVAVGAFTKDFGIRFNTCN